jgi:hypothetical protein
MDGFIDFCNLNPARTTTDTQELEAWLSEHGIAFRHRDGPAGDTVFLVHESDYARAAALWGEYRGSADYILKKHAPWLRSSGPTPPKRP